MTKHSSGNAPRSRHERRILRIGRWTFWFPVAGFFSLVWLLVRLVPKPSRASYPCMKVAAPMASGFLTYIGGLFVSAVFFRKAILSMRRSRTGIAAVLLLFGLGAGLFAILKTDAPSFADYAAPHEYFVPTDPANTPVGTARGIFPGRVVWAWDSTAANWNGKTGNWWEDTNTDQAAVESMLSRSLQALTGTSSDAAAWDALFQHFNERQGRGLVGYQPGEKIAVKINLVDCGSPGTAGSTSFPAPQVVFALLAQLVRRAGADDADITFFDTGKYVPSSIVDKCRKEFPDVHFMGWGKTTRQEKYVRDANWTMRWSENLTLEIGGGHPAYLPTTVTEAAYLINLASFKAHRYVGVTSCAKNHFGTISCDGSDGKPVMEGPHAAGLHAYVTVHDFIIQGSREWSFYGRPMGTYNALVDLMGHRHLGAKTFLFMIDGLYATQTEHDPVSLSSRWLSSPFNNDWTSSLFLSQDEVALESVDVDFFRTEAAVNSNIECVYGTVDNYLHEAAQANAPPSGTVYDPEGDGIRLESLGVHEHWNDPALKQYSRNLGTGNGIELVALEGRGSSVDADQRKPSSFALFQNYPNPFNPRTTVAYHLNEPANVKVTVFDIRGMRIRTLVDARQPAGEHSVVWTGDTDASKVAASGVYVARLQIDAANRRSVESIKMVLQK
jgi:hypothetical protein